MEGITKIQGNEEPGTHGTIKKIPGPHRATTEEGSQHPNTIRTGHAPLAKHLFCIGKVNSPICPACQQSEESIQHYMLHIPAHHHARQQLQSSTGGRDINIRKIFSTPKYMHPLFQFITATQHLHNTFGDIPTLNEERRG